MLVVVVLTTLAMLLLPSSADGRHGLCVDGIFGPVTFARPHAENRVEVRWEHCEDLGDITVLALEGPDGPLASTLIEMVVVDPFGTQEILLAGVTDEAGEVEFDHDYHHRGEYVVHVTLDGEATATLAMEVVSVPDHVVLDHDFAISTFMTVSAFALAGYIIVRRKGREV